MRQRLLDRLPGRRPDVRTYDGQLSMGPIKWQVLTSTDTSQDPIVRYGVTWSNLPKEPTPEEATEAVNALIAQLGGTAGPTTTFLGHEATTFKGVDLERPYIGVAFVVGDDVYARTVTSEAPTQKRLDEVPGSTPPDAVATRPARPLRPSGHRYDRRS